MLFDLLTSKGNMTDVLIGLMASVFVVFCTLPIHEFAHAFVATKLGDDTARLKGRLTLNPLAHIDPIGAAMIILVGFGYAKAVPFNARRFKNPKVGTVLVALAGPSANILMALFFMLLSNGAVMLYSINQALVWYVSYMFFYYAATINVSLAVFNLLPVPPLDGSKILAILVPSKYYFKYLQYERYVILGVFLLIILGVLDVPLSFLTGIVMRGIEAISKLPFMLF
ncbi:MAG: site-2 protease family protein [Clostridia bacterium]|nr:site-2 protease family protein [Clostridia bacterium]